MSPISSDALMANWVATQRFIYDKVSQERITDENPRAFPRHPDGFAELWPHLKAITPMDPWRASGLAQRLYKVRHAEGDVIECGVFMGAMSVMMALLLRRWGVRKRVYMLDSFRGLPRPDRGVDHFYEEGWFSAERQAVERVVDLAGVRDDVVIMPGWFHETLPGLTDERFCLAHLDGDLYASTRPCIDHLIPRMTPGSVVVADDYFDQGQGVRRACEEHLRVTGEQLFAGPVTQAYFFPDGARAKDRNRHDVRPSLTELRRDRQYVQAMHTVSTWLKRDSDAARRVSTLLQRGG